jgi:DNA-directed RNA polymerase specialized sigma24 family protein
VSGELIDALRKAQAMLEEFGVAGNRSLYAEAADEIERLQAERNNDLKGRLDALSDDQRLELFGRYCAHCGCKQPESGMRCQCWNDE